mgnify:FL=1
MQENPVVTWYLVKVREDWAWLEKYLAGAQGHTINNTDDDVRSIFMKLKTFWDAMKPNRGQRKRKRRSNYETEKRRRKRQKRMNAQRAAQEAPIPGFKTEWNEELDAVPRKFDSIRI